MLANSSMVPGVLDVEVEGVACVGVAAPQDRTFWMHAVVNMVRFNCAGTLRKRVLRSAL